MATKFKIFQGDAVNLEGELNYWVQEKEKIGNSMIDEVHFSADSQASWSVLVKYSEWEPAGTKK